MTMSVSGLRVLRGPDWRGGDTDGGEGHVGTVIEMLGNHTVRVLWDMGQESTCSAGHDGKCELQIIDTAQIGVCHPGTTCVECEDTDLYGMLWRCQLCAGCDLCHLCYHDDKHDLRHQFLRIDVPGTEGIPVPKRKTSVKNRALGIFAGSKVTRGKDWQWGDQDGGEGSEGEVKGYENVSPDSSRNLVKVDWPNGVANTYRLGFYGYVDVTCVEEEAGPCYYRDHLPVLDTTTPLFSACPGSESAAEASSDLSQGDDCGHEPLEADDSNSHTSLAQTLDTGNNSTGEASQKTSDSRRWRKEDSGIVVDQETDDGTASTGSVAKEELSELCDLTSSSTLQKREVEEKTADERCLETDDGTISTGSVAKEELSELCDLTSSSTLQKREVEEKTADERCLETDDGTISTGSVAKEELSELCDLTSSSTLQKREVEEKTADERGQETVDGTISTGSVARGELSELSGLTSSSNPQEKEDKEKTDECCPETLGSADEVTKREEEDTSEDTESETFAAGDKVTIKVPENKLMELQEKFHMEGMPKVPGETGEVVSVAVSGAVTVRFTSSVHTFHPLALTKVPTLKAGSTVRIREKEEEVKVLNARVGWREELRATIGKVGRVLNIDSDGDVLVSFGRHHFLFAPACCVPAPHTKPDSLRIESGGKLPDIIRQAELSQDKKSSASGENTDVSKKKTDEMYRALREKIQSERMMTRGRGDIQALYNAIKHGDHVTVRAMCLADKTLVEREYQNLTPLVGACVEGDSHIPVVRALMEAGANPNHGLPPFNTPLSSALQGQSDEMVELLLEAGADPFLVDPKCHTYIHIAAAFDLPRSIRAFIARGVDVNIKDDFQDTALHVAIEQFKNKSVEALVQLDSVDLGVRNKKDFPALHLACLRGNARAVELIVERDKSNVNEWYHGKSTPLHIAANNDHDECIRVLVLTGGANINLQDNAGACYAPMHLASIRANFKAVEALLEMGADIHVQDSDGDTPLHLSIGGRQEDNLESETGRQECQLRVAIACMLISNGAYVDVENRQGRNPLTYGVHPVREGVRRFVEHNPELVKRKGGGSSSYGRSLQSLSNPSSLLVTKGDGDLKEVLKGMGLPCGLCGAPKADVTLLPCQHKCVCSTCSVKVTECPLCDEEVKDKQVTGPDEGALDPEALAQMLEQLK